MNIITTKTYVAGVFAQWNDAQDFLLRKPANIRGFTHINNELAYPFYLLESEGQFTGFQTKAEVRDHVLACRHLRLLGYVVYVITDDYCPDVVWSDQMGNLEHTHHIVNDTTL